MPELAAGAAAVSGMAEAESEWSRAVYLTV